jgi:tetrahydromethanopterin S-methyltransferase subunit F
LKFLAHLNSSPTCKIADPNVTTIDNIVDSIEYRVIPFDSIDYVDTVIVTYQVRREIFVSPGYNSTIGIGIIGNPNAFRYLNQIGKPVAVMSEVQMVEVTLTAYDPRIVLSTDWIDSRVNEVGYNEEFRKRELRRLLRASYWRQTRLISKNLKR